MEFSVVGDSSNWNPRFESLPKEILHLILNFCDKKDYYHILLINKYWSPIVLSDYSFKKYFFTISDYQYVRCRDLVDSWEFEKIWRNYYPTCLYNVYDNTSRIIQGMACISYSS
jgi:hypothetical protein